MSIGPDSARYLAAGAGMKVSRPFHLRWLAPHLCGDSEGSWWALWLLSWPLMAGAMFWWRISAGDTWTTAVAATVLLAALPGILGPVAAIPVNVDLPATAVTLLGVAVAQHNLPIGVAIIAVAACLKETSPVFGALWLWSPWPLLALAAVGVRALTVRPGPDPLGDTFADIAAHPIKWALKAHRGQWRDAWIMVAPWGMCLAALYHPDIRIVIVGAIAYAQLLVATDSVRLYQHAAGPVFAVAAANTIPPAWLPLAAVAHVVWWRQPHRI